MNAATHTIDINDFSQQVISLQFGHGLISTCLAYLKLYKVMRQGRLVIATSRQAMALCHHSCPLGACMSGYVPTIKKIRDSFISISNMLEPLPLAFIFRKPISNAVDDWDDLVDDFSIGSDQDIRKAIANIADRL
jgi:hypothetical protein